MIGDCQAENRTQLAPEGMGGGNRNESRKSKNIKLKTNKKYLER